jgi:ATP-dependent Clp protease ATP-binding subunit ClpC
MFEKFTDRGRRAVVLGQEEARAHNRNYIGTEHILLGLIRVDEGVSAQVLDSLGISPVALRQRVEEIIGQGLQAPSAHIPFSPRAKKVLELALRESVRLGHNYVGTEHILLGLIREGEGVAAQVLIDHGADLDRTRQEVTAQTSSTPTSTGEWAPPTLRPARDRVLAVIEPAWRTFYHSRLRSCARLLVAGTVTAVAARRLHHRR